MSDVQSALTNDTAGSSDRLGLARAIVEELLSGAYQDAAVFIGGSFLGPAATPTSDLDLVAVFDRVATAWRETLQIRGTTVEVFAHDPETFAYFCHEVDGPAGMAPIAEMIADGVCLSPDHPTAKRVLSFARSFVDAGPPALDATALAMRRYGLTTLLEDLADARRPDEALMIAAELQAGLADLTLRGAGLWSGEGKQLARRLRGHDGRLAKALDDALRQVARQADGAAVAFEAVAHRVLEPFGGPLLIGHRLEAPASWRVLPDPT